jgi:two-component system, NtrC family, nitrogen regulation response regulator NtrX
MTARTKGATILVADDEAAIRDALRLVLEHEGYRVLEAADGEQAARAAEASHLDGVLLDIRMPRLDGLAALKRIRAAAPALPVLMISGHGTIETAVEALRAGAQDFLEKPLEREVVLRRLDSALERARLHEEADSRRHDEEERFRLVGESAAMQKLRDLIRRAGPTQATVLITGESGTGKELVARAIHEASSRADGPFVKVNCAAVPDELIESELFGHEKGSFTGAATRQRGHFARAHCGTIFLDEIGDMSLRTQAKVLRALQDGEIEPLGAGGSVRVDVRVIAATNKDLKAAIGTGQFREDLYYRLGRLPIHVPPLRERREDVPQLVAHFTGLICRENNLRARHFSPASVDALARREWPGNVRELRNALERAIILAPADVVEPHDLPDAEMEPSRPSEEWLDAATLRDFKERSEREYLRHQLGLHGWNMTRTAQAIGTPRSNLYKRLEHHGLVRLGHIQHENS